MCRVCNLRHVIHMVLWSVLHRYPVRLWIVSPWSLNGPERRQQDLLRSCCRRPNPLIVRGPCHDPNRRFVMSDLVVAILSSMVALLSLGRFISKPTPKNASFLQLFLLYLALSANEIINIRFRFIVWIITFLTSLILAGWEFLSFSQKRVSIYTILVLFVILFGAFISMIGLN